MTAQVCFVISSRTKGVDRTLVSIGGVGGGAARGFQFTYLSKLVDKSSHSETVRNVLD